MKRQAEKANRAQVELHIARQKKLGERGIGDFDRVRAIELIVTGAGLALLLCDFMGWMK